MMRYVLLLGSNLGDSVFYLRKACNEIEVRVGHIIQYSKIITTEPFGEGVHFEFLNQALVVNSDLPPETLLNTIEDIERGLGRNKEEISIDWRNANRLFEDRTIDIDIVLMDSKGGDVYMDQWNSDRIRIPHIAIKTRPFVKELLNSLSINF